MPRRTAGPSQLGALYLRHAVLGVGARARALSLREGRVVGGHELVKGPAGGEDVAFLRN